MSKASPNLAGQVFLNFFVSFSSFFVLDPLRRGPNWHSITIARLPENKKKIKVLSNILIVRRLTNLC